MKPHHGLSRMDEERIISMLKRFPELDAAVLFGSRAKGTHKPASDIDLALTGEQLDWRIIGQLYDALDDLLLPYQFSLIHLNTDIDDDVAAHIKRVGIPLYRRNKSLALGTVD